MSDLCVCGHIKTIHSMEVEGCGASDCSCKRFVGINEYITEDKLKEMEMKKTPAQKMGDIWWEGGNPIPNMHVEHRPGTHDLSLVPNFLVEKENLNRPTLDIDGWKKDMHGADVPEVPPSQNNLPAVWDLVMEDIKKRDEMGTKKYGTRLQPFNSRDALWDAYQEALDMVVYLRQAIFERDSLVKETNPNNFMTKNEIREKFGFTRLDKNYDGDADEKNKPVPDNL